MTMPAALRPALAALLVLASASTALPQTLVPMPDAADTPPAAPIRKVAPKPKVTPPAPRPAAPPAAVPAAPVAATPAMPAAAAPQADPASTGELEPVLHARNAGIRTCMDNILTQAGSVIDRPHTAISTWVSRDTNAHAFQSIVGLSYPNKAAPNGAAVIVAVPTGLASCEGGSVQIYPTSQPCSIVQAGLIKSGHTLATLQSLPVVQSNDGARNLLMPTAGSGCVVVTVRPR